MLFNAVFANNTIWSSFSSFSEFLTLWFDFMMYFMIPAVIAQIFVVAAEPVILIAIQSKGAEREIKLKS